MSQRLVIKIDPGGPCVLELHPSLWEEFHRYGSSLGYEDPADFLSVAIRLICTLRAIEAMEGDTLWVTNATVADEEKLLWGPSMSFQFPKKEDAPTIFRWKQSTRRKTKYKAPESVQKARQEIARNYDKILVSIGRRDGFHCAKCQATSRLRVDHIKPLINGGSNDLENLQILCQTCNSQKHAQEIDYRQASSAKVIDFRKKEAAA